MKLHRAALLLAVWVSCVAAKCPLAHLANFGAPSESQWAGAALLDAEAPRVGCCLSEAASAGSGIKLVKLVHCWSKAKLNPEVTCSALCLHSVLKLHTQHAMLLAFDPFQGQLCQRCCMQQAGIPP